MEMLEVGGSLIQVACANNFMGHGFGQFTPELIFRVLSKENGFECKAVLLHEVVTNGRWFLASNPQSVASRVELCNSLPTYIVTIAQRISDVEIFARTPPQSDFVTAWEGNETEQRSDKWHWSQLIPVRVRRPFRRFQNREWTRQLLKDRKRPFDRNYFQHITENELLQGQFDGREYYHEMGPRPGKMAKANRV